MRSGISLPSIAQALRDIETGALRARDLAEHCLARISARNPEVQAFLASDAGHVRAQADAVDAGLRRGLLRGIPYAVKDVIETAAYPTTYGSPIYSGHTTGRDAACVALSQEQGAVLLGKVATSEFATQTPGLVRNPLNLAHTPGGSSSGSAAAVADGMAMAAWGTQTTGSITRPAVYCGVVGYKPSFGFVSAAGVGVLSPSQDTVGVLARNVADAAAVVLGTHGQRYHAPSDDLRYTVGICLSAQWRHASAQALEALRSWTARLAAAGIGVKERTLPAEYESLIEDQSRLVAYEARQALTHERMTAASQLSPRLVERLAGGGRIDLVEYLAMQRRAFELRCGVEALFADVDALVYPASDDEAEQGLANSGSPRFGALWTLLHLPTVAMPLDAGSGGLPLGAQMIGRAGSDVALLQMAERASAHSRWLSGV
ncbi:MAG TPA: amidase [Burkholderiaceae bacterium]|nr:amidase [Burkholderiaceae bacterium]